MAITNSVHLKKLEEFKKVNKIAYYKLRHWYEEIKDYDKLSLKEVKKLNKLMLESSGSKKEEIREKLIFGTMHVICSFICMSGLSSVRTPLFDIEDVISSSIEAWIEMLDEGFFIYKERKCYSKVYRDLFYKTLMHLFDYSEKDVSDDEKEISSNEVIKAVLAKIKYDLGFNYLSRDIMYLILCEYIELIDLGYKINERIFYTSLNSILREYGVLEVYDEKIREQVVLRIYDLFIFIISSLNVNDIKIMSKTEIYKLFNLFIIIYRYREKYSIETSSFIDDSNNDIILNDFRNFIFTTNILTDRQREAIIECNGLKNGYFKSCRELAREKGVSHQTILASYNRALVLIKQSENVRKLADSFFEN